MYLVLCTCKAYTKPSSFSSLFNLPYSKDIHYFSQARHITHLCSFLYVSTFWSVCILWAVHLVVCVYLVAGL